MTKDNHWSDDFNDLLVDAKKKIDHIYKNIEVCHEDEVKAEGCSTNIFNKLKELEDYKQSLFNDWFVSFKTV